jgi:hypothetical protein
MMKKTMLIAVVLVLFVLAACTPAPQEPATPGYDDVYTRVSEATLKAGDAVPAPTGEVVLTIRGNISNKNVDDTLQFDMETLEKLGLVEYSVNDYQAEGKVVTFRGVLLRDLFALAGVPEGTENVLMNALNDYQIEFPVADVDAYPVVLATSVDGERMTVERYGPTRVVYPADNYEMDPAVFDLAAGKH